MNRNRKEVTEVMKQKTKKTAVIGAGIVGATTAYYLTEMGHHVTVFDEGTGQATSAAAGVICPWLSLRRNKKWYRLAAGGAAFYRKLIADLEESQGDTSFYTSSGAILLKKDAVKIEEQYQRGIERRKAAPEIGELKRLSKEELHRLLPTLQDQENGLYVGGGARVDGQLLVRSLLEEVAQKGGQIRKEKVRLEKTNHAYSILAAGQSQQFDSMILATGAWLPQILEPLNWQVDIRGQKGELVVLQTDDLDNGDLPVLLPEGEIDVLPVGAGKVYVGASHENEKGYDLSPDNEVIARMIQEGEKLFGRLKEATLLEVKVGTRAYTSDFSPFFGYLPGNDSVLVASGLGSSGLTTGPIIGYQLALLAAGQTAEVPLEDYSPANYLKERIH